jgi:hypothetical protein
MISASETFYAKKLLVNKESGDGPGFPRTNLEHIACGYDQENVGSVKPIFFLRPNQCLFDY